MNKKYLYIYQEEQVDKNGYVYRIREFETIAHAYSEWLKNNRVGYIAKKLEPKVVE